MAEKKISELTAGSLPLDDNSLIEVSVYSAGPTYNSRKITIAQLKTVVYNGLANNISGGAGGQLLYQSAADTTSKLANGSAGQVLQSNGGTNAPSWVTPSSGISGSGTNGKIPRWTGSSSQGDSSMSDDGTEATTGTRFKVGSMLKWARIVIANITGNITNWSIGVAPFYHASANAGPYNIEGIAPLDGVAHQDGTVIKIYNSGSNAFTFVNNSGTTTATNRLQMISNANTTINVRETKTFMYDSGFGGGARWREIT